MSSFQTEKLEPIGDGDLSYTCPPDNEVHIGCFPGVSVVAAKEFGIDYPSKLPQDGSSQLVATERLRFTLCTAWLIGLRMRHGRTES